MSLTASTTTSSAERRQKVNQFVERLLFPDQATPARLFPVWSALHYRHRMTLDRAVEVGNYGDVEFPSTIRANTPSGRCIL